MHQHPCAEPSCAETWACSCADPDGTPGWCLKHYPRRDGRQTPLHEARATARPRTLASVPAGQGSLFGG